MVTNGSRTRVITEKPVKVKKVDMHIFYNAHISFGRTWKVQYENSYRPSAIDSDSIQPLSVLHSGLKREW